MKLHFKTIRPLLLRQLGRWIEECSARRLKEMKAAAAELVEQPNALEGEGGE